MGQPFGYGNSYSPTFQQGQGSDSQYLPSAMGGPQMGGGGGLPMGLPPNGYVNPGQQMQSPGMQMGAKNFDGMSPQQPGMMNGNVNPYQPSIGSLQDPGWNLQQSSLYTGSPGYYHVNGTSSGWNPLDITGGQRPDQQYLIAGQQIHGGLNAPYNMRTGTSAPVADNPLAQFSQQLPVGMNPGQNSWQDASHAYSNYANNLGAFGRQYGSEYDVMNNFVQGDQAWNPVMNAINAPQLTDRANQAYGNTYNQYLNAGYFGLPNGPTSSPGIR